MRFAVIVSVLMLVLGSAAHAQKKKITRKTQEVNFDVTEVDGAIRSPDGAYVNPKKGMKFLPLYKVEKQFDRDIKSSVEYLK